MSAIVCGKRSSFFEDLPSSPPLSKRIRCSSSTSPVRFSPPRATIGSASPSHLAPLDYLSSLFPDMDKQFVEKVLEEHGNDLDSAIKRLNELQLGSSEDMGSAVSICDATRKDVLETNDEVASDEEPPAPQNLPMDGAGWVELFVREISSASNIDDARARATRALEILEQSISARVRREVTQSIQQEHLLLKSQLEVLIHENDILKKAVSIQNERQKESEDRTQELHHLKQLVSQYQEQLRTLEVNNYALTMHLKQAQQSNSIPGRFHPDVF